MNKKIGDILKERRKIIEKEGDRIGDLLSLMLESKDEEGNSILTDSEIVGEIMTFLVI